MTNKYYYNFTTTSGKAARTCIMGVVVTNEYNMASYFPEAGNLNGSNADMCSDAAGPSSGDSGDLFELSNSSRSRTFTISPTTSTTDRHLVYERDYNLVALLLFGECYVIMHKVYLSNFLIT